MTKYKYLDTILNLIDVVDQLDSELRDKILLTCNLTDHDFHIIKNYKLELDNESDDGLD